MKYINTTDWEEECKFICEQVNLIKWSNFFSPKISKHIYYYEEITKKIDRWDKDLENYKFYLKLNNLEQPKEMRVLEEVILNQDLKKLMIHNRNKMK